MNLIARIKEATSGRSSRAQAWAERFFHRSHRGVASEVIESVSAHGGGDMEQLTPDSRLIEDVELNELQRVQLMVEVEQKFSLEISDVDAERIHTIEQLVDCVQAKAQPGPASGAPGT